MEHTLWFLRHFFVEKFINFARAKKNGIIAYITIMEPQKIDIDTFKNCEEVDYCDGGLLFVPGCRRLPDSFIGNSLGFEFAVYCRSGECVVSMNEDDYEIGVGDVFVYEEGNVITGFGASSDFECDLLGYSWDVVEGSPSLSVMVWTLAEYIATKPVMPLDGGTMDRLEVYMEQMKQTALSKRIFFKRELMVSIARCVLYEFVRVLDGNIHHIGSPNTCEHKQKLMRDFFDLLASRRGRIRSVKDSAEFLGISPKYLSRVIVATTGQKAVKFINDYTLRNIALLLRDTDIPIKAVAIDMGFDNASFFGKFVKQGTGLSPSGYRLALRKRSKL